MMLRFGELVQDGPLGKAAVVQEPLDKRALAIVDERLEQRDRCLRKAGTLVDSAKCYKEAADGESAMIQNVTSYER